MENRIPTSKIQTYRDAFERIFQQTGDKTNEMMRDILEEVMWWRENGRNGFCPERSIVSLLTQEEAGKLPEPTDKQVEGLATLDQYVEPNQSNKSYIDLIASSCKT